MELKLFILSDIHAFDGSDNGVAPSFFDISKPEASGASNPIRDLKALIDGSPDLRVDYLLCCGDLADKALPQATERAWKELQEIRILLQARELVSTVGNHDVDSRHNHNDHDAKGALLELIPSFPFEDQNRNCHFWTHHFTCFTDTVLNVRFVVLNSSGYHGEGDGEYKKGRISQRTRRRLQTFLEKAPKPALNILLCHHHPQKHSELSLGDGDDMNGGYELLSLLDTADFGPWIIFHGHKHHPKISYAQGSSCSPVIFSAGSCSAVLASNMQGHARNQVYFVELTIPMDTSNRPKGRFHSWDWAPSLGWKPSQAGSGLPAKGGFGFIGEFGALAKKISEGFPTGGKWKDVIANMPEICNLLPSDSRTLHKQLASDYNFHFEFGTDGTPIIFEK